MVTAHSVVGREKEPLESDQDLDQDLDHGICKKGEL